VGPQSLLTSVSQLNPIKVYFSISDSDYLALVARARSASGSLLAGSSTIPLSLTLADGSVWSQKGHIAFVDREMDQQTGAIRVTASFPNPGNVLRPGQFGRVTAETDVRKNAVLVPQMAVQEVQGIQQVYVVGPDNHAHVANVMLGPQIGKDWIITSGLTAGQRVVTSNMQKLQDGSPVSAHEVSEQAAIETSSPTGTR
jgi:membrane fusion protein (multidrug efflux system)